MRISRVTPYVTAFGYNKEANEKLNSKLEKTKNHKNVANVYLEANKFCMKTEDYIRECERKGDTKTVEALTDFFVSMKTALADAVDDTFPKLNYGMKEYNSYKIEADKRLKHSPEDEDNWVVFLRDSLEPFDEEVYDYEAVNSKKINDLNKSDTPKTKTAEVSNLVELYSPNRWAPIGLASLGGMDELKKEVTDKIIFPLKNPELAKIDEVEYGKRYPRGLLFYGPPGCGKTYTVEALAQELKLPLLKLKVGKAGSAFINQTSNNYEKAFDYAANMAKENDSPVLFFIDEMDGLTQNRNKDSSAEDLKQIGTLLSLIETARDRGIIVIGATNKYDIVDEAIKARFDSQIYVGLPDEKSRAEILKVSLSSRTKGLALAESPEKLQSIASITKGFPNRALCILTDKAALLAREDGRRDISVEDYINVVADNQNLKVKESNYQSKTSAPTIGFRK